VREGKGKREKGGGGTAETPTFILPLFEGEEIEESSPSSRGRMQKKPSPL